MLYFFRLQVPWQRGKTSMSQHGDSCDQIIGTFAFRNQKAEKHTKPRGTLFCCRPPTTLTFSQNKLSQTRSVKSAWIFPEPVQ